MTSLALGTCALGRAIDAHGSPLDGGEIIRGRSVRVVRDPPPPIERAPIERPFWTGVRAIDTLLTIGAGARIGLFGAPGVGKSSLLESIVRGSRCDAVVVGLIGERGREAQRWIEGCDARMTIVCATSDRSAFERARAADVAMAQACALRMRGLDVLLVLDSLARVGAAYRELAIAAGESVGRAGYPPSVFARMAHLVESAGAAHGGTVTLIATVLDDGDARDPVSDAARALLDGHIELSSRLANGGHFPAINVAASSSRTAALVCSAGHLSDAATVRASLALLDRLVDARSLGVEPRDPQALSAIAAESALVALLQQAGAEAEPSASLSALAELADTLRGPYGYFN